MRRLRFGLLVALLMTLAWPAGAIASGSVLTVPAPVCSGLIDVGGNAPSRFQLDFRHPTVSNPTTGYAWLLYGAYDVNIGWTGYSKTASGQYDWHYQQVSPTPSAYWTNYETGVTNYQSAVVVPDTGHGNHWVYVLIYWPDGRWQGFWSSPVLC
jgi:hypothetical protein